MLFGCLIFARISPAQFRWAGLNVGVLEWGEEQEIASYSAPDTEGVIPGTWDRAVIGDMLGHSLIRSSIHSFHLPPSLRSVVDLSSFPARSQAHLSREGRQVGKLLKRAKWKTTGLAVGAVIHRRERQPLERASCHLASPHCGHEGRSQCSPPAPVREDPNSHAKSN